MFTCEFGCRSRAALAYGCLAVRPASSKPVQAEGFQNKGTWIMLCPLYLDLLLNIAVLSVSIGCPWLVQGFCEQLRPE